MEKKKLIRLSLVLIAITCIFNVILRFYGKNFADTGNNFSIEPYGGSEKYFYVLEDYVVDGRISLKQGYYESVELKYSDKTVFSVYIPIDKITLKRLPSQKFTDGTTVEIDDETYELHVNNNEYSLTRMEEN